jgi:(p)ppGpp synthase/HD superfamily hydrolase
LATLERAIGIAAQAHAGQVDKAGAPYILHPLRVMLTLGTLEERIVAVLHDVVEDTDWTFDRLRIEGFAESVLEALDAVTRREGESYEDFVRRAAKNPIGRTVKRADLLDNLDLSRIPVPTASDHHRVAKYRNALSLLDSRQADGDRPM